VNPQTTQQADIGQGASHERKAREIAWSLRNSKVPHGFLVSAARFHLATGTPPRDSSVIAHAKKLQSEQIDSVANWYRHHGLPCPTWLSGGEG
jgi:UDP-N-acetylenolpyruvoylglucosamine reductase